MHPIEFGNIVMMLLGVVLTISGIIIVYRTTNGMIRARMTDPSAKLYIGSNALNVVIGIVFAIAGVLFVLNNLRGNPLEIKSSKLESHAHSKLVS